MYLHVSYFAQVSYLDEVSFKRYDMYITKITKQTNFFRYFNVNFSLFHCILFVFSPIFGFILVVN